MTFKHKLSARLALLRDALALASLAALLGCELPSRHVGPETAVTHVLVSPAQLAVQTNRTSALTAVGLTADGDTGNIAVKWSATGGSIADTFSSGPNHFATYQPSPLPGTYLVIAASSSGAMADTSTVTVTPAAVASVALSPAVATVLLGATLQLTATPLDSDGTPLSGRVLTWSSSAPAVAPVTGSGRVTAAALGSATVTATSSGKSASATITVTNVPVASLTVSPASASISAGGGTQQLSAVTRDAAGNTLSGRVVIWTSSSGWVATVSSTGLVTGQAAGSATITATSEGQSASPSITVVNVPVASVTVSPPSASIQGGATQQLSAVTRDAAGTTLSGRVVTWTSSSAAVAMVSSSGRVTAQAAGSATITATSEGRSGTSVITVPAPPPPGSRVGYYVTPSGSSNGNGSNASPWSLSFALGGAAGRVQPGDTVWLRGGTYAGSFASSLTGTLASPIVVRQYPGERATLDGNLVVHLGSHVWFWGFEVMRSVHSVRLNGLNIQTPGIRLINLVVHDAAGSGIYMVASGSLHSEVYGSIAYNNGANTNLDHGIYAHSMGAFTGTLFTEDNILFNNLSYGLHHYATGSVGQTLRNITVRGNVMFNNNTISTSVWGTDLLLGGEGTPVVNGLVEQNNVFRNSSEPIDHGMQLGYYGVTGVSLRLLNNYMVSTTPEHIWAFTSLVNTGNTPYTYSTGVPTTNRVVVRRNKYEAGRANIIVYNWTRQGSVSVDVSGVLTVGDSYVVKNAQAFYGTPVVSGTYGGGALQLPMASIPAPVPIARGTPGPVTGPTFSVFVLMKTS